MHPRYGFHGDIEIVHIITSDDRGIPLQRDQEMKIRVSWNTVFAAS